MEVVVLEATDRARNCFLHGLLVPGLATVQARQQDLLVDKREWFVLHVLERSASQIIRNQGIEDVFPRRIFVGDAIDSIPDQ